MNYNDYYNENIEELLAYGIEKNKEEITIFLNLNENDDIRMRQDTVDSIKNRYTELCIYCKEKYVNGELDTFKKAACLLIAISDNNPYLHNKKLSASVALYAGYKMCETPIWNVGDNHSIPQKMEEIDLEEFFEERPDIEEYSKELLTTALEHKNDSILAYFFNFEMLYRTALLQKEMKKNLKEKQKLIDMKKEDKL